MRILSTLASLSTLALLAPALAAQTAINRPAAPESRPDRPAPDFELPLIGGGSFRLSETWERGYVVLVFVRGMW